MDDDAEIDLRTEDATRVVLMELVGTDRRVLDVGCGTGDLGRSLRARGCRVVGVERDPDAAETAQTVLDEVLPGDLDDLDLVGHFGKESFDVVVFGDVLQHLADPVAALRKVRPLLTGTGSVVASIPNVAHGAFRLALLEGRFEHRPGGSADAAHLRFFTRGSVYETFRDAGLVPVDVRRTTAGVFDTAIGVRREDFDPGVVDSVEGDPESTTYRFVLRGVPDDSPEAIAGASPGAAPAARSGVSVALVADWVADDGGAALAVRVAQAELARRVPGTAFRILSSSPDAGPSPHDGGLAVEPLGAGPLAADADCVVVTGPVGEAARALAGAEGPVVWSAVHDRGDTVPLGAAVVDDRSVDPGAPAPAEAAETVPHPLLLTPRLLPGEALARRLHYLRLTGWFPPTGPAVVLEVAPALAPHAAALAHLLDAAASPGRASVVLVATAAGDAGSAAASAVAEALEAPVFSVPGDAPVDDVVAVIAAAAGVAATSAAGMALALAYGVPVVRLDARRLPGDLAGALASARPPVVASLQAELDAHFDRVAAVARAAGGGRAHPVDGPALAPAEYVAALEVAHGRMRERLAAERRVVADHLARHDGDMAALQHEVRRLRTERNQFEIRLLQETARHGECASELGRVRAELEALRNTRVLRVLRPARAVYARLRGGRL